jgi:hypothetical protein
MGVGNVRFVCKQGGAEDIVVVPGSKWVFASARDGIRLINIHDRTTTQAFPTEKSHLQLDAKTYNSCPGPVDPVVEPMYRSHGLSLLPGANNLHRLFVVHHGSRESIEIFQADARGETPTLTWIGCAIAPMPIGLNAVVGLADGGFITTNFLARGGSRPSMMAGTLNGEAWEWHTATGWQKVPGSDASGANGIEVSKDGKWIYMSCWGGRQFIRVSRGQTPITKNIVPMDFRLDNLRWAPDGWLFAAGEVEPGTDDPPAITSWQVVKINPDTLKVNQIMRHPDLEFPGFVRSSVAIQLGKELWVGSARGDRILVFPFE